MADHQQRGVVADAQAVSAGLGAFAARFENPLTRAVGRVPATVRTKLLLAFLTIVVVLVGVAALGLRALGQSNTRAESLRTLQVHAAAYQELETEATQVRQLLGLCAGGADGTSWVNGGRPATDTTKACLRQTDRTVGSALALLANATQLDFTPTGDDAVRVAEIRRLDRSLTQLVARMTAAKRPSLPQHARAESLATDLETRARSLAELTTNTTNRLIAENARPLRELAQPPHRCGGGLGCTRAAARPDDLVVARRPDPAYGDAARGDRVRELLGRASTSRTATSSGRWRPTSTT